MRTVYSLFLLLVIGVATASAQTSPARPTLFIIGDSTVSNSTAGLLGWGDPLAEFFDNTKINVMNRARGGRSSRTFQTEGLWAQLVSELKRGDFVMIQFGHNDGGPIAEARARGSLQGTGEEIRAVVINRQSEIVHTYGWYMAKYVRDAKARGAIPIVVSQIPRNIWIEGKVERANETYGGWAEDVAKSQKAFFIDLNEIVARKYEAIGQQRISREFFLTDHTHTTPVAAQLNAQSVVEGLKSLRNCPLTAYLKN
jgi:rhamnogalacturonan acetylesterase